MAAFKWTETADAVLVTHGPIYAAQTFGVSAEAASRRLRRLRSNARLVESRPAESSPKQMELPRELETVLFVPDCHAPHHDAKAFGLMMHVARRVRPSTIVILGDFLDCFQLSFHERSLARGSSLAHEIACANGLLDELDALGASRKVFCEGNHETRLKRYLANKAPELQELVDLREALRLRTRGWEWVPYRTHTKLGKLYLTHDAGYAGKYAVNQTRARFEHNVVVGHLHRMNVTYEGNAAGESHVAACFGWLGDKSSVAVEYTNVIQRSREWQTGFGLGWMRPNGVVHLQAIPIIDGACVVNGELFTAPSVHCQAA